jgi:hypothetical protein
LITHAGDRPVVYQHEDTSPFIWLSTGAAQSSRTGTGVRKLLHTWLDGRNEGNNKPIELKALTIAGILRGNLQKI